MDEIFDFEVCRSSGFFVIIKSQKFREGPDESAQREYYSEDRM